MREIILDERSWAENAINGLDLGKKPSSTIARLGRYYYSNGYGKTEIQRLLKEFIIKCDPTVRIAQWEPFIESVAKHSDKYPLINLNGVEITKNEMCKIGELQTKNLRKLMFTMLCLAKYGNAVSPKNNNWVNFPSEDIFNLANIKITRVRQSLMINDLWQAGYIGYSNLVDNININVKIIEGGEQELLVTDFRNLGNQYLQYTEGGFIQCECCGACVKATNNRRRYCQDCALEMHRASVLENYYAKSSTDYLQ